MSQNAVERKQHIDKVTLLSVVRQCELLEVHRSGLYYQPVPETTYNLELMRLIDEKHMLHPWLGVPRMTKWLRLDMGHQVNHKHVERLYGLLGIQAIGPSPTPLNPERDIKFILICCGILLSIAPTRSRSWISRIFRYRAVIFTWLL